MQISLILKEKNRRIPLPEEQRAEKSCFTCKDFMRYYIKSRTSLREINAGRCKSIHLSKKKKEACPNVVSCRFWTDNSQKEAEEDNLIIHELAKAEKELKNIALFLKATNR